MIKVGDQVRRRDVWGTDPSAPSGPILTVSSVEDQIGQYGNVVKVGGIIRFSDGSVELPGNLIKIPNQIDVALDVDLWDEPIDLGKPKTAPSMREKMLEEIRSHE